MNLAPSFPTWYSISNFLIATYNYKNSIPQSKIPISKLFYTVSKSSTQLCLSQRTPDGRRWSCRRRWPWTCLCRRWRCSRCCCCCSWSCCWRRSWIRRALVAHPRCSLGASRWHLKLGPQPLFDPDEGVLHFARSLYQNAAPATLRQPSASCSYFRRLKTKTSLRKLHKTWTRPKMNLVPEPDPHPTWTWLNVTFLRELALKMQES